MAPENAKRNGTEATRPQSASKAGGRGIAAGAYRHIDLIKRAGLGDQAAEEEYDHHKDTVDGVCGCFATPASFVKHPSSVDKWC